jgi:Skp family chaperone for outer membrane proteins
MNIIVERVIRKGKRIQTKVSHLRLGTLETQLFTISHSRQNSNKTANQRQNIEIQKTYATIQTINPQLINSSSGRSIILKIVEVLQTKEPMKTSMK